MRHITLYAAKTTNTIIMKNLWKFEIIIEFQEIIRLKKFLPIYNC